MVNKILTVMVVVWLAMVSMAGPVLANQTYCEPYGDNGDVTSTCDGRISENDVLVIVNRTINEPFEVLLTPEGNAEVAIIGEMMNFVLSRFNGIEVYEEIKLETVQGIVNYHVAAYKN